MEKEKVIVLKTVKYSEADLIVHGLNNQGARLNFIAKGALRSRKRFGGGILEPTHYISVTYRKTGSEPHLYFLQEASLIEDFPNLRTSYEKVELALYMLQLIAKVSQEGDTHSRELFDLLGFGLRALEKSQRFDVLRAAFEIKLLAQQGVLPQDLPGSENFRRPLAEHESISMTSDTFVRLRSRLRDALNRYLSTGVVEGGGG